MPTFSNKVCYYFVSFAVTANLFVIISFILLLSSCIFNFPPISYVLCEELDFKKNHKITTTTIIVNLKTKFCY